MKPIFFPKKIIKNYKIIHSKMLQVHVIHSFFISILSFFGHFSFADSDCRYTFCIKFCVAFQFVKPWYKS